MGDGPAGDGGAADGRAAPPPPFDPELRAALTAAGAGAWQPVTPEGLAAWQARDAAVRPRPTVEALREGGRFEVAELDARGVRLVSARPAGAGGALPLLYYLHGGGLITGNAWSVLPRLLRELAEPLGLAVVSAEYRLAPAARYPDAVEDCYAGLQWTTAHAERLGVDAGRIVVGGKSAGGGLAAALALLTRDRDGPVPAGQLLLSPMLDDRNDTFSAHQLAGHDTWDRTSNATAWQAALGERRGAPDLPPYAAPARAADLSGLPPAYVEVGSAETFRDEAVAYADALWRAGGEAELHVWPGAFHGFDTFAPGAALSRDAREARIRWLRRILAR
ncbi:alpha/beta hydrolase [Kitasatospora sp. NPDC057692]|uniref:alpha/beta hydrolase n=1 Tax=Kitasatospora sp. NPDC057692 TaxID=3346215 RepID=UPI003679F325